MTDPDLVDRLAEWCKLSERGCWKAATYWDGELLRETWHKNGRSWNPLDSDDDCRVVLERFYEVASPHQKIDFYQPFVDDDIDGLGAFAERLLLATPAEKCQAVLKVLGDA